MAFDLGDPVPLAVNIRNAAGVLTNATTVTLTITLPDGSTTSPAVTNPPTVTGVYTYDYATVQAGRHLVRWVSTGPAAAFTDTFDVDLVASGIVSLADLKSHLNITTTTHDEELRLYIDAATEAVERIVGPVARRTVVETVPSGAGAFYLSTVPVISLTSLIGAYGNTTETLATGSLYVDGNTGYVAPGYTTSISYSTLTATYIAGRAIVPASIRLATMLIAGHLWQTQRGPGGGPPSLQSGGEDLLPPGYSFAIPRRAEELLSPYRLAPAIA